MACPTAKPTMKRTAGVKKGAPMTGKMRAYAKREVKRGKLKANPKK